MVHGCGRCPLTSPSPHIFLVEKKIRPPFSHIHNEKKHHEQFADRIQREVCRRGERVQVGLGVWKGRTGERYSRYYRPWWSWLLSYNARWRPWIMGVGCGLRHWTYLSRNLSISVPFPPPGRSFRSRHSRGRGSRAARGTRRDPFPALAS